MQGTYKVSEEIKFTYQAINSTTGLVITMEIFDETGAKDAINFPDVVLTETGASGRYYGTFTPDATGVWTIMAAAADNSGKVVKQYDIASENVTSIGAAITALNDVSVAEVNTEVDTALADYDVAKVSDITSGPMVG